MERVVNHPILEVPHAEEHTFIFKGQTIRGMKGQTIAAVGSTTTAIFGALEPLTAVLLGMLVLGETLTLRPAVGMAVIFVSVTLLMMRKRTT